MLNLNNKLPKKKLDKTIVISIMIFLLSSLLLGLLLIPTITLNILGVLILASYFVYIVAHIFLFYPTIGLAFYVSDKIEDIFPLLCEKSDILSLLLKALTIVISFILIQLIWSYIGVSFVTDNYTIPNYIYWMRNT